MTEVKICTKDDIEKITEMRVSQQIEDWGDDFRQFAGDFYIRTEKFLRENLERNIFFCMLLVNGEPAAMSAVEDTCELPQINLCAEKNGRHGYLVSVYTKPEYRGQGYQQMLMEEILKLARIKGFTTLSLTTDNEAAKHIYTKFGFKFLSEKFNLDL